MTPPKRPDDALGLRKVREEDTLANKFKALGAKALSNAQEIRGSVNEINSALGNVVGIDEVATEALETSTASVEPTSSEAEETSAEEETSGTGEESTEIPAPAPFAGIENVASAISGQSDRVMAATTESMNAVDDGARAIIRIAETEAYAAAMANHIASVPGAAPAVVEAPVEPVAEVSTEASTSAAEAVASSVITPAPAAAPAAAVEAVAGGLGANDVDALFEEES